MRRKHERPPEDRWAIRDEKYEQGLLSKYYEFKGWNMDGIPTREKLESLDLGYVADDCLALNCGIPSYRTTHEQMREVYGPKILGLARAIRATLEREAA